MAFDIKDLSVLAYANGFTLWHYKTTADAAAKVDEAGYFDAAADMLRTGDMILANVASGGAGVLVVNAISGGTVDTADMTAWTATDTR